MDPAAATAPRLVPVGDEALLLVLADHLDRRTSHAVWALAEMLREARIPAVAEVQPALGSVLLVLDTTDPAVLAVPAHVNGILRGRWPEPSPGRRHAVNVCFDEDLGPDLASLCQRLGCDRRSWIERFVSVDLVVHAIGFLPGFAYMGDLPADLRVGRRSTPRVRVPAGSVAVADAMAAVYPIESPGGWHLVGATTFVVFDPLADPPATLAPGDVVTLVACDRAAHERALAAPHVSR
jgi:KipI family sensor histidine kinase inhibitor